MDLGGPKLPDIAKYDPDPAPKRFILLCHCHQAFEPLDAADEIVRDIPVYLVSSQSATWLLGPGQHNIRHVLHVTLTFCREDSLFPVLVPYLFMTTLHRSDPPDATTPTKEDVGKICCPTFFVATNITKLKFILCLKRQRKFFLANSPRIFVFLLVQLSPALKNIGLESRAQIVKEVVFVLKTC
jgi:hypothetical protein